MKVTLHNDFHDTEETIHIAEGDILSRARVRRIHDSLCGSDTCCCSGAIGMRGHQEGLSAAGLIIEHLNDHGDFQILAA